MMRKGIAWMLICLLLLSMAACGEALPEQTEPSSTETTAAPETTEATAPAIDNSQALIAALQTGGIVELAADVTMEQSPVVYGGEFCGNEHTITGPVYVQGDANTENGLTVVAGIVRDVTIVGAYRCIGDSAAHSRVGEVRLYNEIGRAHV